MKWDIAHINRLKKKHPMITLIIAEKAFDKIIITLKSLQKSKEKELPQLDNKAPKKYIQLTHLVAKYWMLSP